jgi:hypothetical protein
MWAKSTAVVAAFKGKQCGRPVDRRGLEFSYATSESDSNLKDRVPRLGSNRGGRPGKSDIHSDFFLTTPD